MAQSWKLKANNWTLTSTLTYFFFSSIAFSKILMPSWEALIDWAKDSLACWWLSEIKAKLFWSSQQDDSSPSKEDDEENDKLFD